MSALLHSCAVSGLTMPTRLGRRARWPGVTCVYVSAPPGLPECQGLLLMYIAVLLNGE